MWFSCIEAYEIVFLDPFSDTLGRGILGSSAALAAFATMGAGAKLMVGVISLSERREKKA
jgi:hypothetical protein